MSYIDFPPNGNENGLVGFWNFNEGSGTVVFDKTLNYNNGTINGPAFDSSVPYLSYQLSNSNGCDSTAILNLIIYQPDTSFINISACDSYEWNNTTYAQSGTYFSNVGTINNYSMNFDGLDDFIDCGQANNGNILSNNATWMAWVKCDDLSTPQVIASKWVSGSNTQWAFGRFHQNNQSGEFYLTLRGANGSYNSHFSNGFNLQAGEWSHISVVWNQDSLYFYKNGALLNTEFTGQYSLNQTSGNLLIGAQNNSPQEYFWDGKLDDIQIWNQALTQQEIQNYMTCPPNINESSLVRYWNFDEGSGSQIIDQSSSGIDGVVYGPSWSTDVFSPTCQLVNTNGCDSVAVLNLTINQSDTSYTNLTACDSVEWNGTTYNNTGTYIFNGTPNFNSYSLYFDGNNDYVEAPSISVYDTLKHDLTLSAWIKLDNSFNSNGSIIARRDFVGNPNGERHHFELTILSDKSIAFSTANNQNNSLYTAQLQSNPNDVSSNTWHYVSCTFENGNVIIYVDGQIVASQNFGYREMYPNSH